jgi:threonine/homoserine efflux transporter RhtA
MAGTMCQRAGWSPRRGGSGYGQRTLLPVFAATIAAIIGAIVLRQIPSVRDAPGITLVVLGVATDREKQRKDMRWTT